jgi:hypothetical protein
MLKTKARMTYAQAKLITLIEGRNLRRWCLDNGLTHSAIYRLAIGEQIPTYKIIASTCHLIAPIEWLFFTDEKLPYKPVLLPQWHCEEPCKYVKAHRYDYKTIAEKYSLDVKNAYNIFVTYRANPTPAFIREVCTEVNPVDFFTSGEGEIKSLSEFVPDRGDIVSVEGKIVLVITRQEANEKNKSYTGCTILSETSEGIELTNTVTKGKVCTYDFQSFAIKSVVPRTLIEKVPCAFTKKIIEEAKKSFE